MSLPSFLPPPPSLPPLSFPPSIPPSLLSSIPPSLLSPLHPSLPLSLSFPPPIPPSLPASLPSQQEIARGAGSGVDDSINLDVHAISELKSKGLPPTNDLPKYNYSADDNGKYSKYML